MRCLLVLIVGLAFSGSMMHSDASPMAVVQANNYGKYAAIIEAANGLAPTNTFVEVWAGPVGGTMSLIAQGHLIEPGRFDLGPAVIPTVPGGGAAQFQVRAWDDARNFDDQAIKGLVTWTQVQLGSFDDNVKPSPLKQGPDLAMPFLKIVPGAASTDPLNHWRVLSSGTTNNLFQISYLNNTFVVLGESGIMLTSSDAMTWTRHDSGTTHSLRGIAYGHDIFVVVGDSGIILNSPDAIRWTQTSSPVKPPVLTSGNQTWSPTNASMNSVSFGNDTFIALGEWLAPSGYPFGTICLTSTDGTNWVDRSSRLPNFGVIPQVFGIIYGHNRFLALADADTIISSTNGAYWFQEYSEGWDYFMNAIAYGNDRYVSLMWYSYAKTDATPWTKYEPVGNTLGLGFGQNRFVTLNQDGTFMSSQDGAIWLKHIQTPALPGIYSNDGLGIYSIAYGNGTFVAVGKTGYIIQSAPLQGPQPVITANFNPSGCALTLLGTVGQTYDIQSTADISSNSLWLTEETTSLTNNAFTWIDNSVPQHPQRFYRAIRLAQK